MPPKTCPDCSKTVRGKTCSCGWTQAKDDPQDNPLLPRHSDRCACGSNLELLTLRCAQSGLWPRYVWRQEGQHRSTPHMPCPYACPVCRHPLSWDGGCSTCYGSATSSDRDSWTFPGDRYERDDFHWAKVDGPRKCLSTEENMQAARIMAGLVGRIGVAERRGV